MVLWNLDEKIKSLMIKLNFQEGYKQTIDKKISLLKKPC